MRKRLFALAAVLAAILAPTAGANAPIRESFSFSDVTFYDAYLSDACGFAVFDTVAGSETETLFPSHSGASAHEIDTLTGTITYAAPDNGKSLSRPVAAVSHALYPQGVSVGAPAVVTITGLNGGSFTGAAPPGAGRIVANALIVGIDSSGIPFTAFGPADVVSTSGNFTKTTAAICAALS